ncbi:MAG: CUAEP/CCAEP-tail radical SAM protein [Proteobacteria bacterium]|nr:CUAEP/CCAEP-tail radical SAM protein [Pseudomonadota bacterium]
MRIALLSCYELGHQPHGLAMPVAFLERAGYQPVAQDLAIERLDEELIRTADFVGISVPMHTALRLGVRVAARVRELNPSVHLCFFGLYAPLNEVYLRASGADAVLGGEHEAELVALIDRLHTGARDGVVPPVTLAKLAFPQPQRTGLPQIGRYAKLIRDGREHVAGYTETSRGCLHLCRHCPIPPVYGGRFFVVNAAIVLADLAVQVEQGAEHVTFGDPDFFNGPGHGLAILRELHRRWPALTFDVTIKISHLIAHRALLVELASLGCAFVVSAVESLDDGVLARLDKGHTRADFEHALALMRSAGLVLRPTFVPFTPWTTLDQIADLVDFIAAEGLMGNVDPVQLSVRLLVPPGSLLLGAETRDAFGELDSAALSHQWTHSDPRVDRLQQEIAAIAADAADTKLDQAIVFARIRELVHAACGRHVVHTIASARPPGPPPPRLSESWFC